MFTVEVTQADIDQGVRHDCGACPLACAIVRQTGKEVRVANDIRVYGQGVYCHTTESWDFMHYFDQGKTVKPQTFVLHAKHA